MRFECEPTSLDSSLGESVENLLAETMKIFQEGFVEQLLVVFMEPSFKAIRIKILGENIEGISRENHYTAKRF